MGTQVVMRLSTFVIPAKAGIHSRTGCDSLHDLRLWIPACAGMTRGFV